MIRPARYFAAVLAIGAVSWLAGCSSGTPDTTGTSTSVSASADASAPSDAATPPLTGSEAATDPDTYVAPTSEAPPPATTPVPAPEGGDINSTVPYVELTTNAPVELTQPGDYGNGVTVALTGIESVTTTAELPGEIAGPGVKVTVVITNGSAAAIDLGNVIVDLQDAAGTPATPMTVGATAFTGSVAPGETATGVYIFTVPTTYANPATVSVSYSTEAPIVVFKGDAK